MGVHVQYPHLTFDPDGNPRISDTRYKLLHLAGEHFHYGWTAEELLRQHPDLKPEEVYAALTYFYDHHDQIVRELEVASQHSNNLRPNPTLSRDELLRRQALTEHG